MSEWIQQLKESSVGEILENEPLSKHTTWKIGGPADVFIETKGKEELVKTINILNDNQVSWQVLGRGSNVLVSDKGFQGAIISLNKNFQEINFDGSVVQTEAGASLIRLANLAAKNGLTGLEFAGGIPGTIGGAIYMNAGAHGSDISQILESAEVLLDNGGIVTWRNTDFEFEYRTSILQRKKAILLTAVFSLMQGDRKIIAEDMARFKDRRRRTQPFNYPCTGSVFKNPPNDYAGRLIEQLGLKGFQIGGAQVSTIHANFIVNTGNATAKDVLSLIDYIKDKVYQEFQVVLESEVELIGEK
ncbi:UDP-N-acetylenolpyruvoylglucosamine reductase [Vulcanibacillus modesticaldus]|uniref:UDP-N-acetylenolpyruvoylglucosamine reductase n=1 Tax=Vulcanibacillus modesticaldus TaxID=337097 RepID=A0A1D2YUZ2_9BACI|nr:UDP-N-acetylmuramate dehydrogenase [Vulcanibacillus modesticaldus]OEF99528.1 UDP-N-acetylenolpyruvoylglucosamine reductase [Vulcanibacillus modesticaldus]